MRQGEVHIRLRTTFVAVAILLATGDLGNSAQIPSQAFLDLGSSEFRKRETAQFQLLEWGRKQPGRAISEFLIKAQTAEDPEVRERCMSILRSLVLDEYLKEGDGYIGIALALKDEVVTIPGDPKERHAIRVVEVRMETPGQRAGIQINDLIVGLGDKVWRGVEASPSFRENIKSMKPTTVAGLKILRNGELLHIKVTLGRRPLDAFLNGQNADPDAGERMAREAYFQEWLSLRKAAK